MTKALICPRCQGELSEPSARHSAWQCARHGAVQPLRPAHVPSAEGLHALRKTAAVPVWLPWPIPLGWLVTGFTGAGDDRSGTRGCVVALSGPNPVGGLGEMLIVSEEPGLGLGAGLAGLAGPDPGEGFAAGPPHALVQFGHHEFPLWSVESPGAAVFAGEVLARRWSSSVTTSSRCGAWNRPGRPCSPGRCWPAGCGSSCGRTRPAP